MKILLTGGSGYIGGHLINKLSEDHEIFSLDNKISSFKNAVSIKVDLLDCDLVKKHVNRINPDFVIHAAGIKIRDKIRSSFQSSIEINLIGSLNLLEALRENHKVKKIIIFGSAEEYGNSSEIIKESTELNPINAYSFSKQCLFNLCNYYIKEENLPIIYIRPSLIYGPDQDLQMFIPQLIESLKNNKLFYMTKGEQKRDFLHVYDLVNIIKIILDKPNMSHVYNLGSGNRVRIVDVACYIAKNWRKLIY